MKIAEGELHLQIEGRKYPMIHLRCGDHLVNDLVG